MGDTQPFSLPVEDGPADDALEQVSPEAADGGPVPITADYYRQRRSDRAALRSRSSRSRQWAIVFASVLAVVVLAAGAEVAFTSGRIHPGVSVAGIDVGGMRRTEASRKLAEELARRAEKPVIVEHEDLHWTVRASSIGLGFDERAQIADAIAVGRDEDFLAAVAQRARCWFGGVDVPSSPTSQQILMRQALDRIAEDIDVAPVDASVRITGAEISVLEGKDGVALDRETTSRAIVAAFASKGGKVVNAPVRVAARLVTRPEAEAAAGIVKTMLSGPVTVTFETKKWEFEPEGIGAWIDFRTLESSATSAVVLEPFVSAEQASGPVTKALGTKVGRLAKDATFEASNGVVTIIPSQEGIGPDVENLALTLTDELKDPSSDRVVELRTSRTEPAITTEKARTMGIKERISTYTTTYSSGNRPRVNNIHLLGDALDGTLIEPGGVFSFNEAAGERTAAKGYQEAGAIVNGKLVPQLGGGVCQVGTTIFNTVFFSGLPVVERHNHSFYISHYPTGRDATVSWGGPDFKFKNDTPNWVLVVVGYTNSSITISLYGTDPGYDIEVKTGAWSNVRPYRTEEVDDPTLYVGVKSVEDGGVTGRKITVQRIVSKDGKVIRIDSFTSNYKPKIEVVRVGTKPRPSTVPTPTP